MVVEQGDDEVGLEKGKEDTLVSEGFLGSEQLSGVVGGMSRIRSTGWSSSWGLSSENPSLHSTTTKSYSSWRHNGSGIPDLVINEEASQFL